MKKWTETTILSEALKFTNRSDFQKKSNKAYQSAYRKGILDTVCKHMPADLKKGKESNNKKWTVSLLHEEGKKYSSRIDFWNNNSSAYVTACNLKIIDSVCQHMKSNGQTSVAEKDLSKEIGRVFASAEKYVDRSVNIPGIPTIKRLDIDIFVAEKNKGIEFDGTYWHSHEGLKRGRPTWPQDLIENYDSIKDSYFRSKNIEILHVSEKEWIKDRNKCIRKCLDFLEAS